MSEPLSGQPGEEKYLTQEERMMVRRLLKFTEEYPDELGTYITEFIKVHGLELPVARSLGYTRFRDGLPRIAKMDSTAQTIDDLDGEVTVISHLFKKGDIGPNSRLNVLMAWGSNDAESSGDLFRIRLYANSTSLGGTVDGVNFLASNWGSDTVGLAPYLWDQRIVFLNSLASFTHQWVVEDQASRKVRVLVPGTFNFDQDVTLQLRVTVLGGTVTFTKKYASFDLTRHVDS